MKHRQVPPSLHFRSPNPAIDFENSPFYVNDRLSPFPQKGEGPLRAGVSSFGIGGTNVHVILEEAPRTEKTDVPQETYKHRLLVLSARSAAALEAASQKLVHHLDAHPGLSLDHVAFTLQTGRRPFPFRKTILCNTVFDAVESLLAPVSDNIQTFIAPRRTPPVVLMFSGQGSQYVDMGWGLYQTEPTFREAMDRCFDILRPLMAENLKALLYPATLSGRGGSQESSGSRRAGKGESGMVAAEEINRTDMAQPAIFALEYALSQLLFRRGIRPRAMIGHSIGEYVAAHLAGVFSLEEALKLVVRRGALMQQMPTGTMLSVSLPVDRLEPMLDVRLSLAAVNGPSQCVVSGPKDQIEELAEELENKDIRCRPLHTSHAFHSRMMEPMLEEFEETVRRTKLEKPTIPYISNLTGKWITGEQVTDPLYWCQHLRQAVRFWDGLQEIAGEMEPVLVEVGAGRALTTFAKQLNSLNDGTAPVYTVNLVRHPGEKAEDDAYFLGKVGVLWLYGITPNWETFYAPQERKRVALPTYSFERQSFPVSGDPYKLVQELMAPEPDSEGGLYLPFWKSSLSTTPSAPGDRAEGPWLVFHHEGGMGQVLVRALKEQGNKVISVLPGEEFQAVENDRYLLKPCDADHYRRLFSVLRALPAIPSRILILWGLRGPAFSHCADSELRQDMVAGFYTLFHLARAIGEAGFAEQFRIFHVTGNIHGITGEEIVEPGKAMALGVLKVLPQEYPNIRCRCIDIDPTISGMKQEQTVKQVIREISGGEDETVVAFRGNRRWTRNYDYLPPEPLTKSETAGPLRPNGVYLITGGLGKIGLGMAGYLARALNARLVLTGRTPFPPRDQWEQLLSENDQQDPLVLKIDALLEIETDAAGLMILDADVADLEGMRRIVRHTLEQWGEINGVIHAAGIVDKSLFKPVRDAEPEDCEIHFRAKVEGLRVLEEIWEDELEGREPDFCWAMSSVSAVLGGIGFAAYAAANIYMDAFVARRNRIHSSNWISVDWDGEWYDHTPPVFRQILALEGAEQVVFSLGSSLKSRIDRWIKLGSREKAPSENETGDTDPTAVDRPALLTPYVPPETVLQEKLTRVWQKFFKFRQLGIEDDFFELGGDSLKAVTLIGIIHKELHKEIPVSEFFSHPTIRLQSEYLETLSSARRHESIRAVEKRDYYPLSSAQKRLFVLQQMEAGNTGYNMPNVAVLVGELDKDKLEQVFVRLIQRHESLRTSFHMVDEEPAQQVHEPGDIVFKIETHEKRGMGGDRDGERIYYGETEVGAIIRNFVRPFDLSQPPLLRVALIRRSLDEHVVVMDIHHIITDGVSFGLFYNQLMALYHGETLPPLNLQYKDFAVWQQSDAEVERVGKQQAYWLKEFDGDIPILTLPTDFPRPSVQVFEGASVNMGLGADIAAAIKKTAQENDSTLFMVMLSVYAILLSKLSGQEDIVVGTPSAGREHSDLQSIMGMFVNTLALRHRPVGGKEIGQFLKEVKNHTLKAFENREVLFEDLVELVDVPRDTARNPLFDVMFSYQNLDIPEIRMTGLELKPYGYEAGVAKFDLLLGCIEGEEDFFLTLEYCTRLFKEETVRRFIGFYKTVLSDVVASPHKLIQDIEIIDEEERKKILDQFNDTGASFPDDVTIHGYFKMQAVKRPDNVAIAGPSLAAGSGNETHAARGPWKTYQYSQFDAVTDELALVLRGEGVGNGSIVGLMVPRSVEMMVAIFAILKAGGVYLPISIDYPGDRVDYILADSGAQLVLDSQNLPGYIEACEAGETGKGSGTSSGKGSLADTPVQVTDLAYIIYTSGSTGRPKGVAVEHRPVLNRLNWMQRAYPIGSEDTLLQKTPTVFDVSIWELFWWSFQGAALTLLGHGDEKSPEAIVSAVREHGVTTLHFVPSMLSAFLEYIETGGDTVQITTQLKSLRQVFASGEALGAHQVKLFNRLLWTTNKTRLINLYGPTEATVDVSYFDCDLPEHLVPERVPIGKPIDNIQLVVLDRYFKLQPVGIAGELCIAGTGLARGYLNRPELTSEKFVRTSPLFTPLYKTGDLARWLPDGNIEFLGRIDFQVKIRGFRIELGEIENRLLSYEGVKETIVIPRTDGGGDTYLCAYVAGLPETESPAKLLRPHLAETLPEYMIPAHFVLLEKLPLTPNGKIDRKALPEPVFIRTGERTEAVTEIEKKLVNIWSDILARNPEDIGIDDGFFDLGGHSLKATVMVARVHKECQVKISLADIFKHGSIRELAAIIEGKSTDAFTAIEPAPEQPYYAVSSAQKRLYVLQAMDPENTDYNMNNTFILEGPLDIQRLETAFNGVIQRHEVLRTGIEMRGINPVQVIHPEVPFKITFEDSSEKYSGKLPDESEMIRVAWDFVYPFDLSSPPLMRVLLIKVNPERHLLVLDFHHIVTDGTSTDIVLGEVVALYSEMELPPLRLQYKDFSHWQNKLIADGEMAKQEAYWLDQFKGDIPVLELPFDFPMPEPPKSEGANIVFPLDLEKTSQIKHLIQETGTTFFMFFLAVYNILLARYTGQDEFVIGSAVGGRRHADLENILGMFVNMIALRIRTGDDGGDTTFAQFLEHVKEVSINAFENQDYQFDQLVNRLGIEARIGRTPLFDAQFNWYDASSRKEKQDEAIESSELIVRTFFYGAETLPFQLGLFAMEKPDGSISMILAYLVALFKRSTIEDMTKHYIEILEQCLTNRDIKLKDIKISHTLATAASTLDEDEVGGFDF